MIQYEIIDTSKETDFNERNKSIECMACHFVPFVFNTRKYL